MIPIPQPHKEAFSNGIRHPELYLWDAWSYHEKGLHHLYCLALSRHDGEGNTIPPMSRDQYPFHVRHFTSGDDGLTWRDQGVFLGVGVDLNATTFRTVWSGSIHPLPDGRKLVAYTGIENVDERHRYRQSIGLAISASGGTVDAVKSERLSSPTRDWSAITDLGYYLDIPSRIGSNLGEGNGPIMAWRDPFVFLGENGWPQLFWAAKTGPRKSAMARAQLMPNGQFFTLERLFPPIELPDGDRFTQLELPKVLYDDGEDRYYLMVSTCNRFSEKQPDSEVDMCVRLYTSKDIAGPWESLGDKILGREQLFGPTVLRADFQNRRLLCMAAHTKAAPNGLPLTFAPPFYIDLDTLAVEFLGQTR